MSKAVMAVWHIMPIGWILETLRKSWIAIILFNDLRLSLFFCLRHYKYQFENVKRLVYD